MHVGDKTYLAASLLVDVSEEIQRTLGASYQHNLEYAKNFCTVKVGTSRRSGHTTSMLRLCERFESSLIVVLNIPMIDSLRSNSLYAPIVNKARFVSRYNIDTALGVRYDAILIDCASIFRDSEIAQIYDLFVASVAVSSYMKPAFIVLFE